MVLPILAIGAGTVALAGVALAGIAVSTPEDEDTDIFESLELTLIRTGYIAEGVVKGTIVAAPPALLVVLAVSLGLSLFGWVGNKGDIYA
tara:strand:+ start:1823 stop:2092 length:270 start_codon:yes stop_codon:yes gene_type:complete